MTNKVAWIFKRLHLIVSFLIIVPIAVVYGSPSILPAFIDIEIKSTDLHNMLRAIMCLYLGVSSVFALGIWKDKYWKVATQLNALFMLSLGVGRLLSILLDGLPTQSFVAGLTAEFTFGFYAVYQLQKYKL